MTQLELEEKLRFIDEAIKRSGGDKNRLSIEIDSIIDPQEKNQCDGCQ